MADTIKIEDIEERVVLVGVSEQDGDDADDSLSELAHLSKEEKKFIRARMSAPARWQRLQSLWRVQGQQASCAMMS